MANRIVIDNVEGVSYGEIDDTFDRWEINLGETEVLMGPAVKDPLEAEFLQEEDDAALRAELAALRRANKQRANSQHGESEQNSERPS